MSEKFSRRDFLKISGVSTAVATVLTGCGPLARYVTRKPYTDMPEYNQTGASTYFATTCRECPAGCGLIIRTQEGRAIKAEGNPRHPVNHGKICSRGLTAVQGLYNPDRVKGPVKHERGSDKYQALNWDAAVKVVGDALAASPKEVAFLVGLAPDHIYDLASELTAAIGAPAPVRHSILGDFDGRFTLVDAAAKLFGKPALPFFDLAGADLVVSFGANFLETWVSPVGYSLAFAKARKGGGGKRATLISFEPRQSLTSGNADEWYGLVPGSEGLVAQALGQLVAQAKSSPVPPAFSAVNPDEVAMISGISSEKLHHVADLIARAAHPLALPGGGALGHSGGSAAAQAILALNVQAANLGKPGGVFLTPVDDPTASAGAIELLIASMNSGKIKALFIHGNNPVFELPAALGFKAALAKVPLVVSFSSFPDETALASDYIFPDHTGLESFGYQRILPGADREAISATQPAAAPLYDTRASADVLLAAARLTGGDAASKLNYTDEVDFIQKKLVPLLQRGDGAFGAPEIFTFWAQFLQYGGWWKNSAGLDAPKAENLLNQALPAAQVPAGAKTGEYFLVAFSTQLGDGSGANRPWLQELPDPTTTVTWNTWVEIAPETAERLGFKNDDIIKIKSAYGEIEVPVYQYPAIRPDTIAIPFGNGHEALGQYAAKRGANPAAVLNPAKNDVAGPAFGETFVTLSNTGRQFRLARVESREGVYGKE